MSCCGIDPIASVRRAVTKPSHSLVPPLGQNSNFDASAAAAMIVPGPPAMSPTNQAMTPRPTMIMTDWNRSVMATDHIPDRKEHTSELQSPCNLVCRLLLEKKKQHEHR